MRLFLLLLVIALALGPQAARSQQVLSIQWPTAHASPPPELSAEQQKLLPLLRLGVSALPESSLIQMSGVGASLLGVPETSAAELQKLLVSYYETMASDAVFKDAPSSLGYCFSAQQPRFGLAQVYVPREQTGNPPVILFLHGFGGNFQFYLHFLSTCFPQHLIISPSFGISMAKVNSAYLKECLTAVSGHLKSPIQRPVLIGLSAGGFGGFREVFRSPGSYRSFTCLAAYPPVKNMPIKVPVNIIVGGNEVFVRDGTLHRAIGQQIDKMPVTLIPDADHFFLLSHPEKTREALQASLRRGRK